MFKEYSLKNLFIFLLYGLGCYMAVDYIGGFTAGLFFIVLCLISIERVRNEEQDKQIQTLKEEIDNIKKELNDYKSQLLEG